MRHIRCVPGGALESPPFEILRNFGKIFAGNRIFAAMKDVMELFAELGSRLRRFGTDATTRQVVEAAHAANGWFLPEEIVRINIKKSS